MGNGKWENNRLTELKSSCNQNTMTFFQTNARGYGNGNLRNGANGNEEFGKSGKGIG